MVQNHTLHMVQMSMPLAADTHTTLSVALHPGLVASHAVRLRSIKASRVFRQTSRTTSKPVATHSFTNDVWHNQLLVHTLSTNEDCYLYLFHVVGYCIDVSSSFRWI